MAKNVREDHREKYVRKNKKKERLMPEEKQRKSDAEIMREKRSAW